MGITRRAKTLTAAEQTVASFPTASDIHALATDGGYVYFANTSTLYRAPESWGHTPAALHRSHASRLRHRRLRRRRVLGQPGQ